MIFPFFTFFLTFVIVLSVLRNRSTRAEKKMLSDFWSRENEANNTRKVNLDTISYYEFSTEGLPFGISDDLELISYEEKLTYLSEQKMLNLNGLSNTDLKLQYGPQNLDALIELEQIYASLEKTIYEYGKLLYEKGFTQEGIHVLERGIALPTDLAGNYTTLMEYYKANGQEALIPNLADMASQHLNEYNKSVIMKKIHESTDFFEVAEE